MVNEPNSKVIGSHSVAGVPIEVVVTVGRAKITVQKLISMSRESILLLDRGVSAPVEVRVGDRLIALGVLEEVEGDGVGQLAVRLVDVIGEETMP